ncbi:MAG: alpha/beta hydrolase [Vicinamibacterales bacterium]
MSETRGVSFSSANLTLEGQLHLPDTAPAPGIVVCHPHPQYGGDMHNNVVDAICETAVASGISALRFNFRGTGRSEGRYDNGIGEQYDVRAAFAYLRDVPEVDTERVALAGYSFGAGVAVHVASTAGLRAFIGVSLPTTMPLEGVTVACPALFVSGDEDEYSDADDLTEFVSSLGPQAELKLLPGLGHFWFGVERDLKEIVAPFLKAHLAAITTV